MFAKYKMYENEQQETIALLQFVQNILRNIYRQNQINKSNYHFISFFTLFYLVRFEI